MLTENTGKKEKLDSELASPADSPGRNSPLVTYYTTMNTSQNTRSSADQNSKISLGITVKTKTQSNFPHDYYLRSHLERSTAQKGGFLVQKKSPDIEIFRLDKFGEIAGKKRLAPVE